MQLTGTIYFDKRATWSMWMTRRFSVPASRSASKANHPGQQEEST
jgi:hypothetical protein